ncbi:MAG: acyl--CoA ligase, partial [Actinobacteria bacterium]|nr:acyl--CoA ligase [Actinomycetota bacterium]
MSNLAKFKVLLNPRLNLANFWDETTKVYGDKTMGYLDEPLEYRFMPKGELSYRDSLTLVNKMGNMLRDLGVCRGDRVVIAMGNRIELLLLCYACFKTGAIAVPLNYMLKGTEIKYIAENCGA